MSRDARIAAALAASSLLWIAVLVVSTEWPAQASPLAAMTAAASEAPAPSASQTASAAAPAQSPPQPAASAAQSPAAGYAGDDTCLLCHDTQKAVWTTAHGRKADARTPAAQHGCASCHGPGQAHVDDDEKGHIRKFGALDARVANDACLGCHAKGEQALWSGSAHDGRRLACTTCHSVHAPKSVKAQLKLASEMETCATCHQPQVRKTFRVSHMPVRERKMNCSSCHNPHGTTNVRLLRVGNWINESCVSCHAEKRGPFIYEHAAGRESCVSCHDPHGSSNERMLVAKLPMLCQRCHIGTRHPSTIYDSAALASRSNRLIGRSCVNCHSNIHGSNHPSGGTFLR